MSVSTNAVKKIDKNNTIIDASPVLSSAAHTGIDTVVLGAQQEAAASAVLRDIRRARAKPPAARPGDTPVWALVAARGAAKLKPEAAAEMARARMAAATAAAVMRDAAKANDGDSDQTPKQQQSQSTPSVQPLFADDDLAQHDFMREYMSPKAPNSTADAARRRRPSSDILSPRPKGAMDKKSVSFVEGTIFHTKK